VPVAFWYLSILGGTMLLSYAIYRQDVVFILGQSMGLIVYVRNLVLIRRVRKADKIAAAQAAAPKRPRSTPCTTAPAPPRTRRAPMSTADRLSSRLRPFWVLILALLSFWVGLAELPVQDRDEARYAQASRQMAETGDWVDIRFQDAARHVKPVGVYWMQAAVLELTGQTGTNEIWVHRIPSFSRAPSPRLR
jgi:hypothetical protein